MIKLTTNDFIKKANKIHNHKYDYSLVDYINTTTNVKIICPIHNIFEQTPATHLIKKCGCPSCSNVKKLTTEEFIKKANEIHNNRYDYSLVDYISNIINVRIICNKHGIFEQRPSNHIRLKHGCPICSNRKKYTLNEFIKKANDVHNNKYDYSLVEYKNNFTKIKIICPEHGTFEQKPINHLIQEQGCLICSGKKLKTTEEFISLSKNIHGDLYNYDLVDYVSTNKNVKIICPVHGIFEQKPTLHINRKSGCPNCKKSKGELQIIKTLNENNISFIHQKEFNNCKDKNILPFDFYLPDYNLCIEYDGIQHYEIIDFWGGVENYEYVKKHDQIKNDFCKENNIKLIRIKYDRKLNSKHILEKIYSII